MPGLMMNNVDLTRLFLNLVPQYMKGVGIQPRELGRNSLGRVCKVSLAYKSRIMAANVSQAA
jgi:hypothetical protein